MKNQSSLIVLFFCAFFQHILAQKVPTTPEKYTAQNKGKFYIFGAVIEKTSLNQIFVLKERTMISPYIMWMPTINLKVFI